MSNDMFVDKGSKPVDLGNGSVAIEAIDVDGATQYWLYVIGGVSEGPAGPIARHELTGPLPGDIKRAMSPLCASARTDGKPCRQMVASVGDVCRSHSGAS